MKKINKNKFLIFMLIVPTLVLYSLRPGGYLSWTELGHVATLFAPLDRFHIIVSDNLSSEKVDVYWNDDEGAERKIRIIHQGKPDELLPGEHGSNSFSIYYDGQLVARQEQVKFANWHYHSYTISIFKNKESEIVGSISSVWHPEDYWSTEKE